jgi:hypothetical protein
MRSILFVLLVLVAAFVVVIRWLPWWGVAALFAGLLLSIPVLIKWALPRLLRLPFKAKGAVLSGASVTLHSVERAEAPPARPDDEDDEVPAGQPREHYRVDLTVTPPPASGAFALWEPGELVLVRHDARADKPEADKPAGKIHALEVEQDGRFEPDCGMKYGGPQRLRLLVSAPPGQRVRFRYYFEVFGDIALPARARAAGGSPFARAR